MIEMSHIKVWVKATSRTMEELRMWLSLRKDWTIFHDDGCSIMVRSDDTGTSWEYRERPDPVQPKLDDNLYEWEAEWRIDDTGEEMLTTDVHTYRLPTFILSEAAKMIEDELGGHGTLITLKRLI